MGTIRRELQVAFSPRVQPVWFRLIKWSLLIITTIRYGQSWWFRYVMSGALISSVALHMLYRQKTLVWQRAWGGWSDITAAPR